MYTEDDFAIYKADNVFSGLLFPRYFLRGAYRRMKPCSPAEGGDGDGWGGQKVACAAPVAPVGRPWFGSAIPAA